VASVERRVGWAGVAAIPMGLAVVAASCFWWVASRDIAIAKAGAARRDALASQQRRSDLDRQAVERPAPGAASFPEDLRLLYKTAAAHGLQVARAEYRTRRDARNATMQVDVSMPLEADYATLKAFLSEALAVLPNLAVEEFRVQRHDASDGVVQARLVLTLLYRRDDR